MNVLIIEDNETKLNTAKQVLQEFGITDVTHVNNLSEALYLCFRRKYEEIIEFDLIILDLCFYKYRPSKNAPYRDLSMDSGYRFLSYMIDRNQKKDVIIFSSEDNYLEGLKDFLFTSYEDYMRRFDNRPFVSYSETQSMYEKHIQEQKQKLDSIDFVLGHAHNEYELSSQLKKWLESRNNQ